MPHARPRLPADHPRRPAALRRGGCRRSRSRSRTRSPPQTQVRKNPRGIRAFQGGGRSLHGRVLPRLRRRLPPADLDAGEAAAAEDQAGQEDEVHQGVAEALEHNLCCDLCRRPDLLSGGGGGGRAASRRGPGSGDGHPDRIGREVDRLSAERLQKRGQGAKGSAEFDASGDLHCHQRSGEYPGVGGPAGGGDRGSAGEGGVRDEGNGGDEAGDGGGEEGPGVVHEERGGFGRAGRSVQQRHKKGEDGGAAEDHQKSRMRQRYCAIFLSVNLKIFE